MCLSSPKTPPTVIYQQQELPEIKAPPATRPQPSATVQGGAKPGIRTNTMEEIAARTQSLAIKRKKGKSALRVTGQSGMNYPGY